MNLPSATQWSVRLTFEAVLVKLLPMKAPNYRNESQLSSMYMYMILAVGG